MKFLYPAGMGPSERLGRDFDAGSRFHGALYRVYVDDA